MYEKQLVKNFVHIGLKQFNELFSQNYKLYHYEFPINGMRNDSYRIDLVLKNFDTQQFFLLEFKNNKIRHSALDQLNVYMNLFSKKFYINSSRMIQGGIVSSIDISKEELNEIKKYKRKAFIFDGNKLISVI